MRFGPIALAATLASGCTTTTTVAPPDAGGAYSRDELDAELAELEARAAALAACRPGDALVHDGVGWSCTSSPACPPGFTSVVDDGVPACTRLAGSQLDVVVKVGDVWIDRYEVSACPGGDLGGPNGQSTTAAACSSPDQAPQVDITWFQAAALCANAGKHLCTNAEWQVAVAGTPDPVAPSLVDGPCLTSSGVPPRKTGLGGECRSRFGAEDMIGNLAEWVAEWRQVGRSWQGAAIAVQPWPIDHGADRTENVDGVAHDGTGWRAGLPSALTRGGAGHDTSGGAFALDLGHSPSAHAFWIGARCCLRGW